MVGAVNRKALRDKIVLDAPLSAPEIAVFLGRSLDWVYNATTDGRLRMHPTIKRMTPSQIRADLARGAGRR